MRFFSGRQVDSSEEPLTLTNNALQFSVNETSASKKFHGIFIRSPKISKVGANVSTLAIKDDGEIVGVWQSNLMATTFHPELTDDLRFHKFFLDLICMDFDLVGSGIQ